MNQNTVNICRETNLSHTSTIKFGNIWRSEITQLHCLFQSIFPFLLSRMFIPHSLRVLVSNPILFKYFLATWIKNQQQRDKECTFKFLLLQKYAEIRDLVITYKERQNKNF